MAYCCLLNRSGKIILLVSECYDAIETAHQETEHGGTTQTKIVKLFTCENYQLERNKTKIGIAVKPIIASNHLNSR